MMILLALALAQADVRQAVERSLPFLEKEGVAWMRDRKCVSCHHVTFMVWTHREALSRGFAVDEKKLDEWTRWTLDVGRKDRGVDTLAQVVLTRPPAADVAPYRELAELFRGLRKPDGLWEAAGQLTVQRRPKEETHEVSTMWALRALDSLGYEEPRLKDGKPGQSAESAALRLLANPSEELLKELLGRQNGDGGWSYLRGETSDALATGQVLYALSFVKADVEPARRARAFLVKTQREDGSWNVPTTKARTKEPGIAIYWGTAWAVLGLLQP
ncbi:MAG TPA: prenyltransferase/squalene oxidase repeat-containing protein [Planctomycetota bacterium]